MHAIVSAIKLNPHVSESDQNLMKIQSPTHDDTHLPPIDNKLAKDMATESLEVLLSADKDALRIKGEFCVYLENCLICLP